MPILWIVVALLGACLIGLAVALVFAGRRLGRLERQYRSLVAGTDGGDLEDVLNQHLARVHAVGSDLGALRSNAEALQEAMGSAIQHVGIVRFNPFADSGGDFSFAIALADANGNGLTLYNLHGRGESRLYAKPLRNWSSPYALADEEAEAIRLAQTLEGEDKARPRD